MGLFGNIKNKKNHEKCVKAFNRIKHTIEYSTSNICVISIGKNEGYSELYSMISDAGWSYEITGNEKEGYHLTVKG